VYRVIAGQNGAEKEVVVAAVRAGDSSAFTELVQRHRRELQMHCYRMLGSFEESEDLVQEAFLRAWRKRGSFQGRATFRVWLYKIATNACLDHIARHPRRPMTPQAGGMGTSLLSGEIQWLQPYPDRLLDTAAPFEENPDAVIASKELVFIVAIQHLPPRQRVVLILRDVLGWSASEAGELLEMSVAAVKSSLQRARGTLRQQLPAPRLEWGPVSHPTEVEQETLQRYMEATERGDVAALANLLNEDAVLAMPAWSEHFVGRDAIVAALVEGGFGSESFGELRCRATWANRQPAVANYRRPPGKSDYEAFALDVLRIENGQIKEITAFFSSELFIASDLPLTL